VSGPRPLRVFFATISPGMPGGIFVTEDAFERACAESGLVDGRRLPFGRRRPDESAIERTFTRIADLIVYAWRVITERPDLVHLNTAFDRRALTRDIGYALLSSWLGQPLFLKFHGSDHELLETKSRLWQAIMSTTIMRATAIGVLSSEEKRNFVAAGFPEDRFVVVKNIVDWKRFAAGRWPRTDAARVLFIARMIPAKGLADVIRALKILVDQGRQVSLDAVGDGPARPEAEALAAKLGVSDRVRFTGLVPEGDTTRYYLECGMLAFPTVREGFSMTIFQSLAAGLPVLTTRCRAAADYLREHDHCLWVTPGHPEELARKIVWVLDHPEAAARMSAEGQRLARTFGAETVAGEYLDVYRRIARRPDEVAGRRDAERER
jgi:glycosyltransferase involved in cell wall biosynthesis